MQCLFGRVIYTGREVLSDGYVVLEGSQIAALSPTAKGDLLGSFEVITPAFIDPHSHIGLIRSGEPENEAEVNEKQDSLLTLTDALDSLQMDDQALGEATEMGLLYSCILPGSGNILGGRAAVIRHFAPDSTQAFVCRAGMKAALGYNPRSTQSWEGTRPSTRMGAVGLLRKRLYEVQDKQERFAAADEEKRQDITFSAEEKTVASILDGSCVLRTHVHKVDDIAALLRLVDEFGLRVTVEHAMDVNQSEILSELEKRGIPVVYGPLDAFAYKVELKHESWRNISHLLQSGVQFGLMTDHPVTPARQLLLQTRWFLRHGWSKQQAIELLSRKNAAVLGLEECLGTLEEGKWASLVCWNGDPLDLASYPTAVYGEGRLLAAAEE